MSLAAGFAWSRTCPTVDREQAAAVAANAANTTERCSRECRRNARGARPLHCLVIVRICSSRCPSRLWVVGLGRVTGCTTQLVDASPMATSASCAGSRAQSPSAVIPGESGRTTTGSSSHRHSRLDPPCGGTCPSPVSGQCTLPSATTVASGSAMLPRRRAAARRSGGCGAGRLAVTTTAGSGVAPGLFAPLPRGRDGRAGDRRAPVMANLTRRGRSGIRSAVRLGRAPIREGP